MASAEKNEKESKIIEFVKSYEEIGILIALIVLFVAMTIASPVFFTFNNLINILRQISQISIIAVGMAYIMITGGIDLSVGSTMAFGGMVMAILTALGIPAGVSLLIALVGGLFLGSITGTIIVKTKISPFIATLGMMSVIRGVTYLMTEGMPVPFRNSLNFLGGGSIFGIPVPIHIMIVVLAIGSIVLSKTVFGKNVFAVGGNAKCAKLSGINVNRIKVCVYAITGFLSALAGIISTCNLKIADASTGNGMEMDVIAAVVIGGVSMSGGKGSIKGVLLGAAIMGIIRNGFVLLRLPSYMQMVSIGAVIIVAVSLDQIKKKYRED